MTHGAFSFLENFLTEYAGEVRSMELSNLRARSADSFQWVSADSVHFLFNGSLSQMYYSGSAAFGTEGCSIWAITSGVSGLCPTSSDALRHRRRAMNSGSSPPSIMRAR